jgi:hypothetical protein
MELPASRTEVTPSESRMGPVKAFPTCMTQVINTSKRTINSLFG